MSSDQVAEMAPLVREVFAHAQEQAQRGDLCATFEVVGATNAWAQVTPTEVNVAFPSKRHPSEELGEIFSRLPGSQLISWEPRKFATWAFECSDPLVVARVVDQALTKLFGLADYSVDGMLERL